MNEDSEPGGVVSFAYLERQETERFSKLLLSLEDQLYAPLPAAVPSLSCNEDTRKYYSEGYEANYEGVSENEIRQWQHSTFQYLRVEGKELKSNAHKSPTNLPLQSNEGNLERVFDDIHFLPPLNEGLVVCGHAIVPPAGFTLADISTHGAEHEECIASHGIVQEYIVYQGEVDNCDVHKTEETGILANEVDPVHSQREEVLSSMVDAIWPDIVTALKPLVSGVLHAARNNHIPLDVDQSPAKPQVDEYGEGDFGFASSDDGW